MKKFIITEEEKKEIRKAYGLNESLPDLDSFPIGGGKYNIGYDKDWDDFNNPSGTANSDFSKKPTYAGAGGHLKGHIGVDIFGPRGAAILAPVDGKVKFGGNGLTVIIEDPETGYSHWLGHLDSRTVKEGDFVMAGEKVGTLGDSGNAKGTAPHLHYNIYKTSSGFYSGEDPLDVLKKSIGKKPEKPSEKEFESMGDKFKKAFKKLFGDEEKDEKGNVVAKDEEDLWDKMKKAGSTFFDKLGDLFK
jgi:murein DD-endopeptidase MepM/ murein hydrolase activator NlpD